MRSLLVFLGSVGFLVAAVAWQDSTPAEKEIKPLPVVADEKPRYLKGNLHTHSLWSDGDDFPEMIADWYKAHGYQFLALTDHNVLADGERWIDEADSETPKGQALKKYL